MFSRNDRFPHQKPNKIGFAFFWFFYDCLRILQGAAETLVMHLQGNPCPNFQNHKRALPLHKSSWEEFAACSVVPAGGQEITGGGSWLEMAGWGARDARGLTLDRSWKKVGPEATSSGARAGAALPRLLQPRLGGDGAVQWLGDGAVVLIMTSKRWRTEGMRHGGQDGWIGLAQTCPGRAAVANVLRRHENNELGERRADGWCRRGCSTGLKALRASWPFACAVAQHGRPARWHVAGWACGRA
jgi:hypothetical protein